MAWVILVVAGLFEVVWAVALKYSQGFTRAGPTVLFGAALVVSVALLGRAMREIPLGTAYVVWTGIGAVGTAVVGMIAFHEPREPARLACLVLVIAGVVGLKLLAQPQP